MRADTIDKWDEDKLKEVVEKKHGDKVKPKTDIVSQHSWNTVVFKTKKWSHQSTLLSSDYFPLIMIVSLLSLSLVQ